MNPLKDPFVLRTLGTGWAVGAAVAATYLPVDPAAWIGMCVCGVVSVALFVVARMVRRRSDG